ncbi:MAG TPA: hypothetical protein VNX21_06375, partial [Candidatus Thermoplasmatota archaeon]|nr:hypothetical protein [Candidatus Thermoplasmatota archaeon]
YGVGIAAFTMLVFGFFCTYLSRRNPFDARSGPHPTTRFMRVMQGMFVFPAVSFLFFGVLAASLFLLGKSQTTEAILLLSMSVVVGVRLTAFVSESAAADLAKLLPLSLLGVLIVDPSYADLGRSWAHFTNVLGLTGVLGRYFLVFIALEGAMQVVRSAGRRFALKRGTLPKRPSKKELLDNAATRNVPVAGPERVLEKER